MTLSVVTHIAGLAPDRVTIRGKDLVDDLIGYATFTEMTYFLCSGKMPDPVQTRVLDACLVTLMEHGLAPATLIARLMADSVPDDSQVAIAAGLMSLGPRFAGTSEACAKLLMEAHAAEDQDAYFAELVKDFRSRRAPLPGFGHPLHKPDDPRAIRLFAVAEKEGLSGIYTRLIRKFGQEVDRQFGKHMTINATGAIGALLLEIGLEPGVMRGLAVVSRASGLIGHVQEEHQTHAARAIWDFAAGAFEYEADEEPST